MIYITHVRISLPNDRRHDRIEKVKWLNPSNNNTGTSSVAEIVTFLNNGNAAKVTDGKRTINVAVVDASPPHIRTVADGYYTDNLLSLPKF